MASPLLVLTWKWIEALIYNRTTESWEMALKSISEGLEVAQKNGVHVWDQMLFSQAVYASLNKRDMAMAGEFLKKMETTLEEESTSQPVPIPLSRSLVSPADGELPRASLSCRNGLETGRQNRDVL